MSGPSILLDAATIAAIPGRANWPGFKSFIDTYLGQVLGPGNYQGSELPLIASYALGYNVLKGSDQNTAYNYADKAIGLMESDLRDYQKGGAIALQFIARGDGSTKTFLLPFADMIPGSQQVFFVLAYPYPTTRQSGDVDEGPVVGPFLKISNTPDGTVDYIQNVDWQRNDSDNAWEIRWLTPNRPAPGATYYVTACDNVNTVSFQDPSTYSISGSNLTFTTAPPADQGVTIQCMHGTRNIGAGTSAFQQTHEGTGGFNSIYIDTTYTSRYLGKYLALGLDWLDDYPGLTADLKSRASTMLVRWSDYVRDFGYFSYSPASNYGAGGYCSRVFTALYLRNRDPVNGPRLISEVLAWRTANVLPLLTGSVQPSYQGGNWQEGWNYGAMSTWNLQLSAKALEEAGLL
jgi:hypothetical protein